jgi:hypothetical protein
MAGTAQANRPKRSERCFLQHPASGGSSLAQFAAIQTVAPSFGVEPVSIALDEDDHTEKAITDFSRSANAGLIL